MESRTNMYNALTDAANKIGEYLEDRNVSHEERELLSSLKTNIQVCLSQIDEIELSSAG